MESPRPIKSVSGGSGAAQPRPSLTPQRWQKIKELFNLALEREPGERVAFLEAVCEGDESLRLEVESLLRSSESDSAATSEVFKVLSQAAPEPSAEAEDPLLGRRVGDYRIERRIGLGGMASVYLASRADEQFRMQAAIKLLRPDLDRAELLRRFVNERQTLAALDHPNIVKLLDGGSTDEGLPYLVMDYVEGKPIDEYCDSHSLSIQQRLQLFCKVCEAVDCAHQHRVIHRDLKPNNILVTADGAPKLLDFGIAKVLDPEDQSDAVITRTVNRHLTPAYASPEQVRGERAGAATDVYSLGVVLYELLTGHRPYRLKQRTPAAVEQAICEQEPESPSTAVDRVETETRPDGTVVTVTAATVSRTREGQPGKLRHSLKGDLDNIVLKALQKDPGRRYASVAEFAQDIRLHLEHRPVQARPSTLAYRASKFIRRHKTEVIAAVAVVCVLAAASGILFVEQRRATELAQAELAKRQLRAQRSVVVLGFHNLSGRPDSAWVSTALAEMLNTELSAGGKLRAIPGEDVAQMKRDLSIPDVDALNSGTLRRVHKNLGSDFVVLGSYVESEVGGERRIRVDIRLQDAIVGRTLASIAESGIENDLAGLVNRAGAVLREKLGLGAGSSADSGLTRSSLPSNLEALRLYSEGIAKLRQFEVLAARDLLKKAVGADPGFSLAHSALADAYARLGYDTDSQKEAKKAFDLSADLPREKALLVQARYFQSIKQDDKAIEVYRTLFNFFPDNLDYGLALAAAQIEAGKAQDALQTVQALRKLPAPDGEDPRIDLTEANAATSSDYKLELEAARRAAAKADKLGRRLLAGRARINESRALNDLGASDESILRSNEAKELLSTASDHYGEALALKYSAIALFSQNKFADARKAFEEALHILESIGNRGAEAGVLNNIAGTLLRENRISEGKQAYLQSLAISRAMGKRHDQATTLDNLAIMETTEGDLRSAAQHFQEALAIDREDGLRSEIAGTLENFSSVLAGQGRPDEAENVLQEAIRLSRKSGDRQYLIEALTNLGYIRLNRYGPSEAKSLFKEALQVAKDSKNNMGISYDLSGLANVSAEEGDLAQARNYAEQSLRLREKIGDGEFIALSWLDLAEVSLDEGSTAQAEKYAQQAAAEFHKQMDWEFEARANVLMADALLVQKRSDDAERAILRARAWAAKTQDLEILAIVNVADARYRAATGNIIEAKKLLTPTVYDARRGGFGLAELQARLALGEIEVQSGDYIAGRAQLTSLERDATVRGFRLIARKAAMRKSQIHIRSN